MVNSKIDCCGRWISGHAELGVITGNAGGSLNLQVLGPLSEDHAPAQIWKCICNGYMHGYHLDTTLDERFTTCQHGLLCIALLQHDY